MKKYLLIILLAISNISARAAHNYTNEQLDSLGLLYFTLSNTDPKKVELAKELANEHYNSDSTLAWGHRLMDLAQYQQPERCMFDGCLACATYYYYHLDYVTSLEYAFRALSIADSLKNDELIAKACQSVGDAYSYLNDYPKADSYYYKSLDIHRAAKDTVQYLYLLYSLTDNLLIQKLFGEADSLLDIGRRLSTEQELNYPLALIEENKSLLYYTKFIYQYSQRDISLLDTAKYYGLQSIGRDNYIYRPYIAVVRSLFLDCVAHNYTGERRREIIDSIEALNIEFRERTEVQEIDESVEVDLNDVCRLLLAGDFASSYRILDSLVSADVDKEFLGNLYIMFNQYYALRGDYRNAEYWLAMFYESINSSISLDVAVSTAQNLAENTYKDQIRERERRDEQRRRMIVLISVAVLVGFALVISEYFRKRRHNRELNLKNVQLMQQREEILSQKEEILAMNEELSDKNNDLAHSHKQITDSISYASLIQKAALPKDYQMSELFGDYFLIYRPLNIVAGDFYWAQQIDRFKILVCADCTGHGVPGAFVSMLGISLLNEVTARVSADTKASDILNELRVKLMHALGQSKRKYDNGAVYSMDGMDLAMVMIDEENSLAQFAGAYRPLWIWRDGELIQQKPDKMPIGLYLGAEKNFTNHEIPLVKGDVLYMFSDGIPDQFGYIDDTHTTCKHFSTKRLAALITSIGNLPLADQKSRIESEVDAWKNGYKQLDDNIMIGVRV